MSGHFDVIVIGGGQSGLATGYYLRRSGLKFIILDNQTEPGGAWLHAWKSLLLFSPAQWSSLPGVIMPGGSDYYPTRAETIRYLKYYETKYAFPIKRAVEVLQVHRGDNNVFTIDTSEGLYTANVVVSATGSFANPYTPTIERSKVFQGKIIHSSQYQSPEAFENKTVAIVGEGNSGAQILAEVSKVADTIWITQKEPHFLPDHIDGRYLFNVATQLYEAQKTGKPFKAPSLGDIVMVESVKEARSRQVYNSFPPFERFTVDSIIWSDGREEKIDVVIYCTGFKPALKHLNALNVVEADGKAGTEGTRSKRVKGLWLVGYGNWTGFASATLIGVGRSAKDTVDQILRYISVMKPS
jgi:cation diffusion facilitator CzcD-associated flavoprotein CzcO